jgi:hypothetical protein
MVINPFVQMEAAKRIIIAGELLSFTDAMAAEAPWIPSPANPILKSR